MSKTDGFQLYIIICFRNILTTELWMNSDNIQPIIVNEKAPIKDFLIS